MELLRQPIPRISLAPLEEQGCCNSDLALPDSTPASDSEMEENLLREGFPYALSLTGSHHDAQDLVQEAALRLYRKYGELKNRGTLFTTIRNIFYDQVRRRKVVAFDSLEAGGVESDMSSRDSVHQGQNHDRNDIAELLKRLRPQEREAMYLHYVSGYTSTEIGELTDRSRNTVLSLLRRSREKLEKMTRETS